MKTKNILLFAFVIASITSCTPITFYQLYKTSPSTEMYQKNGSLFYEDENCKISYNFWLEKGNAGFRFYNKTEKDIYLNLGESYFVLNGEANDYYRDRIFTTADANSLVLTSYYWGVSSANTKNTSIAHKEKELICIPSKTSKMFSEYTITEEIYRDCNLLKYPPNKGKKMTLKFNKDGSPFVFSNRLTYRIADMEIPLKIINEFYVSEITNYPEKEFFNSNTEEFCGQKRTIKTHIPAPDEFYLKYKYLNDYWIH